MRSISRLFALTALVLSTGSYTMAQNSISTRVWNDKDGDGIQDNNENGGIDSVKVDLFTKNAAGNYVLTATDWTNTNGQVSFSGINTSTMAYLRYHTPKHHKLTLKGQGSDTAKDSDVNVSSALSSTFAVNGNVSDIDCGMWAPGTVTARVWNDKDGDGIQDNNENGGIDSVKVLLYKEKNGSWKKIQSAFTNSNGVVTFSDVPADVKMRMKFKNKKFHALTLKNQGSNDTKDSDVNLGDNFSAVFQADRGSQNHTDVDCGMWAPGTVEARVWADTDGDGIQDNNENGGIDSVKVQIFRKKSNNSWKKMGTAYTDANGKVYFSNVPADAYVKLKFFEKKHHAYTYKNQGTNDTKDSDAGTTTGETQIFKADRGSMHHTSHDCGLWQPGKIVTKVWNDVDGDGIQDNNENGGIACVKVQLWKRKDDGSYKKYATTYTQANGEAVFEDVPANWTFKLRYVSPSNNAILSPKSQGNNISKDSDVHSNGYTGAFRTVRGVENNLELAFTLTQLDAGFSGYTASTQTNSAGWTVTTCPDGTEYYSAPTSIAGCSNMQLPADLAYGIALIADTLNLYSNVDYILAGMRTDGHPGLWEINGCTIKSKRQGNNSLLINNSHSGVRPERGYTLKVTDIVVDGSSYKVMGEAFNQDGYTATSGQCLSAGAPPIPAGTVIPISWSLGYAFYGRIGGVSGIGAECDALTWNCGNGYIYGCQTCATEEAGNSGLSNGEVYFMNLSTNSNNSPEMYAIYGAELSTGEGSYNFGLSNINQVTVTYDPLVDSIYSTLNGTTIAVGASNVINASILNFKIGAEAGRTVTLSNISINNKDAMGTLLPACSFSDYTLSPVNYKDNLNFQLKDESLANGFVLNFDLSTDSSSILNNNTYVVLRLSQPGAGKNGEQNSDLKLIAYEDVATDDALRVYPNPAYDVIHLSFEEEVTIYNATGALIYKGQEPTVNVEDWANGVYFVHTSNSVVKFIKQ